MRLWYLSHRRPAKAHASLRICAVLPEPSLFAHMNYGGRQRVRPKSRHLAPLYGCACVFEKWIYGGQNVPKSHELAQIIFRYRFIKWFISENTREQGSFLKRATSFEPAHEIMALFVLRKRILQTRMCSHPVGLDVWFFVGPFVYFHTSCKRTAKALARLRGCAGSPEPSLVNYVVSTIISWAGSF